MAEISPPKYALKVLDRLEREGFEAYLVGGCVRDMLLCRRPKDWDICTSALPEQVQGLFPRTHPTGLKHGTVTVVSGGRALEVTTFRADGDYADHRRPDSVCFVTGIEEDLRRRDFTINAMALSRDGRLADPFGGKIDLDARLIRCVGDARQRFSEDALRLLRALRFSAELGFEIERDTRAALKELAPLTGELAAERVRAELVKTLCSPCPEAAGEMLELGLLCRVLGDRRDEVDLSALRRLPKAQNARVSGFCAVLERRGVIKSTEALLRALRLDAAAIKNVSAGVSAAKCHPETAADWKRLCALSGADACFCCACAATALGAYAALKQWRAVWHAGECMSMDALAVGGAELLSLGFEGEQVGKMLKTLLQLVIESPEKNTREELLTAARQQSRS